MVYYTFNSFSVTATSFVFSHFDLWQPWEIAAECQGMPKMSRFADTKVFWQRRAAGCECCAEGTREQLFSITLGHMALKSSSIRSPRKWLGSHCWLFFSLLQLAVCTLGFLTRFAIWSNTRFPPVSIQVFSGNKKKGVSTVTGLLWM